MALFLRQDDERSELQKRIAAELREKSKSKALTESADRPDGVDDSRYIEGTKQTTSLAWVWVLIIIFAIGAALWIITRGMT